MMCIDEKYRYIVHKTTTATLQRVYQKSWSEEGETRVLHATIRKGRRQDQEVVLTPHVWPHNLLSSAQHTLSLNKIHDKVAHDKVAKCAPGDQ